MNAQGAPAAPAGYMRGMLRTVFMHEPSGRRVSYRIDLSLQAKALAWRIIYPIAPSGRCGGSERPLCIAGWPAIIR